MDTLQLEKVTAEDFFPRLGEEFSASLQEGAASEGTLRLREVTEIGLPRHGVTRAPFSLLFEGSSDTPWQQQIIWLSHPEIGTLGIFMVPIGDSDGQRTYEAIFT